MKAGADVAGAALLAAPNAKLVGTGVGAGAGVAPQAGAAAPPPNVNVGVPGVPAAAVCGAGVAPNVKPIDDPGCCCCCC